MMYTDLFLRALLIAMPMYLWITLMAKWIKKSKSPRFVLFLAIVVAVVMIHYITASYFIIWYR